MPIDKRAPFIAALPGYEIIPAGGRLNARSLRPQVAIDIDGTRPLGLSSSWTIVQVHVAVRARADLQAAVQAVWDLIDAASIAVFDGAEFEQAPVDRIWIATLTYRIR